VSHVVSTARPIEVSANGTHAAGTPGVATVAVVMVTWNRKADVSKAIEALSRQDYPRERMHVIVVDNNSTDGTTNFLAQRWKPEWIVENPTERAHEPRFEPALRIGDADRANAGGFASMTIVHNHANMGGCGGFNTGFGYVAHAFSERYGRHSPDFVWLVDDDIDLPPDALSQLTKAAAADPSIGLVGSRTVDLGNRKSTIETTIYFDRERGVMADEPPPGHPRHDSHKEWIAKVGGTRGDREYHGVRDVDVVSACSMLARWSGVQKVGFWDYRYFIYCDDADWCLRFARAGYRVVLNLDAVVFHTPWNMKLTVARIYYAQRNVLWMAQKQLPAPQLRKLLTRRIGSILRDSLRAGVHRRLFHADIIRHTALDVATNNGGKLASDGPPARPVIDCLRQAGALRSNRYVVVLCSVPPSIAWADGVRQNVRESLDPSKGDQMPRWAYWVRNDVPDHLGMHEDPASRPDRIVYGPRYRSRFFRRQLPLYNRWPAAVVVFDQTTDFPALFGGHNLHIDSRKPTMAQLERDGFLLKAAFLGRWAVSAVRSLWFARTAKPYTSPTKYG
jgi:GT2 family glycosyltransferase